MSKLDDYRATVEVMKAEGKSNREIAAFYDTSEKSVRRALKRWAKGDGANLQLSGDRAVIETQSIEKALDPSVLMQEVGLDPQEWHQDQVNASKWGNLDNPQFSLKLHLKSLTPQKLILPAVEVPNRAPASYAKPKPGESELVVIASDFHAPFHDPVLFRQFIDWLAHNQPSRIVLNGDLHDFPAESRHRHKPEWQATAMECVNAAYNHILLPIRLACPHAEIIFLPGNHDERIRNAIIDNNNGLFDLRPADKHGEPQALSVWDIRNLLHLEELGVSYIDPNGTYEYALYPISDKLAATHGWIARSKSAQSAQGTLEALGHSVAIGHVHRLGFYYETTFEIDGTPRTLVAVEGACMCLHKKGLGYARAANWQQGWITATIHPDGEFALEPAVHVNGKTLWRGQQYV